MRLGQVIPITLHENRLLVSEYHRLQACKELGWDDIPAVIGDSDNIDEAFVDNELTAMERGECLASRKEI